MIGLIFGDTNFPIEILKKIKKKKLKYLIIDLSKSKKFKKDRNAHSISIGQFGKIIKTLKENKCKKVLFAGKIDKPKFSLLKLDFKGLYYIPKIVKASKLGDAAILKEIIKIFRKERIKVISAVSFNPELTLTKGNYTKNILNTIILKKIGIIIQGLRKVHIIYRIKMVINRIIIVFMVVILEGFIRNWII